MTHERQWHRNEEPVDEWLDELPSNFDYDPIGMWELLAAGRDGYGLAGDELVHFLRRAVRRLLEYGARPARTVDDGPFYWIAEVKYGETADEILDKLMSDPSAWGDGEPDYRSGLLFATPGLLAMKR